MRFRHPGAIAPLLNMWAGFAVVHYCDIKADDWFSLPLFVTGACSMLGSIVLAMWFTRDLPLSIFYGAEE